MLPLKPMPGSPSADAVAMTQAIPRADAPSTTCRISSVNWITSSPFLMCVADRSKRLLHAQTQIGKTGTVRLLSRQSLFAVGLACLMAPAAVAGAPAVTNPGARYVLTARDVGPAYKRNDVASGGRALADVSLGDSAGVRKELRRSWLGGTVAAYNHRAGTSGVISIADVFRRGAAVDNVLLAWQRDAARVTRGAFETLPRRSPGHHPAMVRGSIAGYEILLYMWSRGHTIASVEVTGKPGEPSKRFLFALVRRQDAKLTAS